MSIVFNTVFGTRFCELVRHLFFSILMGKFLVSEKKRSNSKCSKKKLVNFKLIINNKNPPGLDSFLLIWRIPFPRIEKLPLMF